MKKIAVTGGLSAGKTTVCSFLKDLGAYVVSSDEIVHQLLSQNTEITHKVISLLGEEILTEGFIDREKIAKKVFSKPDKLHALEQILHPVVFAEIEKLYKKIQNDKNFSLFVAEVPLLYESNFAKNFDSVIAVIADTKVCEKRFEEKHRSDAAEFNRRMSQQWAPTKKAEQADFKLSNNGTMQELKQAVQKIFNHLTNKE